MTIGVRRSAAIRLSLFYAAVFGAVGIHLPFWPLWLEGRGFDATEIGFLLAGAYLAKLAVNPFVGHVVDRWNDRRKPLVALALVSVAGFALFHFTGGFWGAMALTIIATGAFAAMIPVGENLTMTTAHMHSMDYGRIRLWGSLAFVAASVACGRILLDSSREIILWLIVGGLAAALATCIAVPGTRTAAQAPSPMKAGALLRRPLFLLFLGTTSLIQVSHLIYYGFATLHWKAAGIADDTIGWLWAEGVIAEVVLFAFSGSIVRRLGPARLITLAAVGAVARWIMLALTTDVNFLAASQLLHAATFGALHLGAMHFVTRAVPHEMSARAQGVYSSVALGLAPGIVMLGTGHLYDLLEGGAFLVMAAVALAGWAAALRLERLWDGKMLALRPATAQG